MRQSALGYADGVYLEHFMLRAFRLGDSDQPEEAEPLFKEALRLIDDLYGPLHRDHAKCRGALSFCYARQGRLDEAEASAARSAEIYEQVIGPDHEVTRQAIEIWAGMIDRIADRYAEKGDLAKLADARQRQAGVLEKRYGEGWRTKEARYEAATARADDRLTPDQVARVSKAIEQFKQAQALGELTLSLARVRQARQEFVAVLGESRREVLALDTFEASLLRQGGSLDEYETLMRRAARRHVRLFGVDSPGSQQLFEQAEETFGELARKAFDKEDYRVAAGWFEKVLQFRRERLKAGDWRVVDAALQTAYASKLAELPADERKRLAEADGLIAEATEASGKQDYRTAVDAAQAAMALRKQVLGEDHEKVADCKHMLGYFYLQLSDSQSASPWMNAALETRRKRLGTRHPQTADTLDNLGALYATIQDYQRAAAAFKEAAEILAETRGTDSEA
jgi:hypothetical protein